MFDKRSRQSGFTFYEIIVVLTIISILAVMLAAVSPHSKDTHALRLAEQQIQSLLRDAFTQALNEERQLPCRAILRNANKLRWPCSDIGIYLEEQTVTLFADIHLPGNNTFEPEDYILARIPLVSGVETVAPATFIFESDPPDISFFANGQLVTDSSAKIRLKKSKSEVTLNVYAYGDIAREE